MRRQENLDPKIIRKQNELNLYKFGQYCADKIDEEIDQLAEDYPDIPDLSALDDWFYGYLDELEGESKKSVRRARYKKIASKAAIVLLALILSSAVVTFSVEAFRIKFFNLFIETSSDHDYMAFQVDEENNNLPESWDSYYFPSYLSKDYSLLDFQENGEMKILFFTDKDEKMLIFTQAESDLGIHIDNDETDTVSVKINDVDGYVTDKDGYITVSWSSNGMIFSLDGQEKLDEMLAIAKEIKKN